MCVCVCVYTTRVKSCARDAMVVPECVCGKLLLMVVASFFVVDWLVGSTVGSPNAKCNSQIIARRIFGRSV